jgi:hypothetical protein
MNLHLAEIATQIAPGAHAAILVDQAGWHLSRKLRIPSNITLIPLPAKCPELNPQENIRHARQLALQPPLQILRRPSSTAAATLGITSSTSHGKSSPSHPAIGPIGHDQRALVLQQKLSVSPLPCSRRAIDLHRPCVPRMSEITAPVEINSVVTSQRIYRNNGRPNDTYLD